MQKKYKSQETLTHFLCKACEKWWTISTAPKNKKVWYCPWCATPTKAK